MEVVPPARIPANKVVARFGGSRDAHALSGTTVRAFVDFLFMKTCVSTARLLALPLAIAPIFPSFSQTQIVDLSIPETRVTATRFTDSASSLPFGVSVITAEDIQRSGVSTVNEAIIKILGVQGRLDFYGGGDYSLDLRGFGGAAASNQVVIVDGIKINEADLSGTRMAGIAIDSVSRIEIIRGSGSVLYGAGATGGVIVITTKAGRGMERKNAAEMYTAIGSYGLREVRGSATLTGGGFSLDVAGNKRQADNHRDNFKSDIDGNSLVGQWSNDWLRLGARYAQDSLNTGLPGSLTAAQYQVDPAQTTSPKQSATIKNTRQSIFSEAMLGDWQIGLDIGNRSKSLDSLSSSVPTYQYVVDANTISLRAKHEAKYGLNSNAIIFGIDQADWMRTVLGAFGSVARQKSDAFYVKNDFTLPGGTRLAAGLRTENIQQTDPRASVNTDSQQNAWELGLTQPLATGWIGYGRIGNSYRLANVDELGFTTPGAVLAPQTSHDMELGTRWNYEGGRAELRFYRNELTNELGYDPTVANVNSFNGFGANVNFSPTMRQGFELETTHVLSKTVDLRLNAGLRESKFTDGAHNGKDVPLVPQKTFAVRVDWRPAPDHLFNAGVMWVSSQSPDFNNACTIPGYATADARYAYQMRNVELSLGVVNLTDVKYYTQAFTCTAGVTNGIYPEAGRTVSASMRIKF